LGLARLSLGTGLNWMVAGGWNQEQQRIWNLAALLLNRDGDLRIFWQRLSGENILVKGMDDRICDHLSPCWGPPVLVRALHTAHQFGLNVQGHRCAMHARLTRRLC